MVQAIFHVRSFSFSNNIQRFIYPIFFSLQSDGNNLSFLISAETMKISKHFLSILPYFPHKKIKKMQKKWFANKFTCILTSNNLNCCSVFFLVLIYVFMFFTFANFLHRLKQIVLKIIQMEFATVYHQSKISFMKAPFKHSCQRHFSGKFSMVKMALIADYTVLHE